MKYIILFLISFSAHASYTSIVKCGDLFSHKETCESDTKTECAEFNGGYCQQYDIVGEYVEDRENPILDENFKTVGYREKLVHKFVTNKDKLQSYLDSIEQEKKLKEEAKARKETSRNALIDKVTKATTIATLKAAILEDLQAREKE